jgi:hypothetical protein
MWNLHTDLLDAKHANKILWVARRQINIFFTCICLNLSSWECTLLATKIALPATRMTSSCKESTWTKDIEINPIGNQMYWRGNVSVTKRISDETYRRWNVSAMKRIGDKTYWQQNISAMKSIGNETCRWGNIAAMKRSGEET